MHRIHFSTVLLFLAATTLYMASCGGGGGPPADFVSLDYENKVRTDDQVFDQQVREAADYQRRNIPLPTNSSATATAPTVITGAPGGFVEIEAGQAINPNARPERTQPIDLGSNTILAPEVNEDGTSTATTSEPPPEISQTAVQLPRGAVFLNEDMASHTVSGIDYNSPQFSPDKAVGLSKDVTVRFGGKDVVVCKDTLNPTTHAVTKSGGWCWMDPQGSAGLGESREFKFDLPEIDVDAATKKKLAANLSCTMSTPNLDINQEVSKCPLKFKTNGKEIRFTLAGGTGTISDKNKKIPTFKYFQATSDIPTGQRFRDINIYLTYRASNKNLIKTVIAVLRIGLLWP